MDILKFQKEHGINGRACIDALREIYPNYGKSTHSMVTQPDKYAVRLTAKAESHLKKVFDGDKPKAVRKKANRLEVRVDDAQLKKIKDTMGYLGCESTQDFLSLAIAQLTFEKEI